LAKLFETLPCWTAPPSGGAAANFYDASSRSSSLLRGALNRTLSGYTERAGGSGSEEEEEAFEDATGDLSERELDEDEEDQEGGEVSKP
jgi:hypothetical protein